MLFSSGFPTGYANNEKIHCTHWLTRNCHIVQFRINLAQCLEFQHWCVSTANVIKTRNCLQWLGFPAHTMAAFNILDCVHWEFQWVTVIYEKLRKIRSRFKVWSSNLDLIFFSSLQLRHLHWEFQCNFANFENILKIPLTSIKQTSLIHSIYRAPDQNWCNRCSKLDGRQQSSKEWSCSPRYIRKKANTDEKD